MYQSGPSCFNTAQAANIAAGSAQTGSLVNASSGPAVVVFVSATDTTISYAYSPVDGSPAFTQSIVSLPSNCVLLTAADAVQLCWLIGSVWIGVYCVRFLGHAATQFFGATNDT